MTNPPRRFESIKSANNNNNDYLNIFLQHRRLLHLYDCIFVVKCLRCCINNNIFDSTFFTMKYIYSSTKLSVPKNECSITNIMLNRILKNNTLFAHNIHYVK